MRVIPRTGVNYLKVTFSTYLKKIILSIILDESEFKETTLNITSPIMANPRDSFIIKSNKATFIGNLFNPA